MSNQQLGFDYRFIHKNHNKEILYDSGWEPNQMCDDGFEHMFDVFFRGATAPTNFKVGLTSVAPSQSDSYADLTQVTGDGYAEESLTCDNTGFPTLQLDSGNMEIISAEVEFENTNANIGNPSYAWDTATDAYLASVTSGSSIFISWKALSISRTLMPGDTLAVIIRQKGLQPE
jgi:hypothetical protein